MDDFTRASQANTFTHTRSRKQIRVKYEATVRAEAWHGGRNLIRPILVDVDLVGDGALMAVLHDEVVIKEADALLGRRGGEADEIGGEVFEHMESEIVDDEVDFRAGHERRKLAEF